jgi:hypothetical protein
MKCAIMHIICAFGWSKQRKIKMHGMYKFKIPIKSNVLLITGNSSAPEVPNYLITVYRYNFLRIFKNILIKSITSPCFLNCYRWWTHSVRRASPYSTDELLEYFLKCIVTAIFCLSSLHGLLSLPRRDVRRNGDGPSARRFVYQAGNCPLCI